MVYAHLLRCDSETPRASNSEEGLQGIPIKSSHGNFCTAQLWNCPFYCKKLAAIFDFKSFPDEGARFDPACKRSQQWRTAIQPYE